MQKQSFRFLYPLLFFAGIVIGIRFLLPLMFPFLLGTALALGAEPIVRFLQKRLGLSRGLSSGLGVSTGFFLVALILFLAASVLVRELGVLAGILPDLEVSVRSGITSLGRWLHRLVRRVPGSLRVYLDRNITHFLSGGSALLDRAAASLLSLAGTLLTHVPDSTLAAGTGILSSYMISAKLPAIREALRQKIPSLARLSDAWKQLKAVLSQWLLAQLKLTCVTGLLLLVGFWILGIPHAPVWAAATALVDVFPVLGTGTVLLPWSLVSFLQGSRFRALGLLAVYGAISLVRSILEPRLIGKQLGLDPLVTLICLYLGFRFWGILGMLLVPLLAGAAAALLQEKSKGF